MATWIGSAVHITTEWFLKPLDGLPSLVGLLIVTVITGGVALWVVKKTTDPDRLVRARHRMAAALYEMRLFLDAPLRVVRAQVRLVEASLSYTVQTLPGLAVLTAPFGMVYLHLELRYGHAPHAEGSLVTLGVELTDPAAEDAVVVEVAGEGVDVNLGPVIAEREGRVYHRLRVTSPGRHVVRVRVEEESFDKVLVAAPGGPVSVERVAGLAHAWAGSVERALPSDGPVRRIWLSQSRADTAWLGIPWWAIWLVGSMVVALLLRRPLGAEL